MGDNSDKKKNSGHLFFFYFLFFLFFSYHYMKFQNISLHGSKVMLYAMHKKATTLNGQKLQRAITPTTFHLIQWKFSQVNPSSVQISMSNIKALVQILFWDSLLTRFQCYYIKRKITLKWEIIGIRKKFESPFFSWGIHIWIFKT